jgi:hypothetical protein
MGDSSGCSPCEASPPSTLRRDVSPQGRPRRRQEYSPQGPSLAWQGQGPAWPLPEARAYGWGARHTRELPKERVFNRVGALSDHNPSGGPDQAHGGEGNPRAHRDARRQKPCSQSEHPAVPTGVGGGGYPCAGPQNFLKSARAPGFGACPRMNCLGSKSIAYSGSGASLPQRIRWVEDGSTSG